MPRPTKNCTWSLAINPRTVTAALAVTMLFVLTVAVLPAAQAQTYTILHTFTGKDDGAYPITGLTMDAAGNLYGTTFNGGFNGRSCDEGCGTVFKLSATTD